MVVVVVAAVLAAGADVEVLAEEEEDLVEAMVHHVAVATVEAFEEVVGGGLHRIESLLSWDEICCRRLCK